MQLMRVSVEMDVYCELNIRSRLICDYFDQNTAVETKQKLDTIETDVRRCTLTQVNVY